MQLSIDMIHKQRGWLHISMFTVNDLTLVGVNLISQKQRRILGREHYSTYGPLAQKGSLCLQSGFTKVIKHAGVLRRKRVQELAIDGSSMHSLLIVKHYQLLWQQTEFSFYNVVKSTPNAIHKNYLGAKRRNSGLHICAFLPVYKHAHT